MSDQATHVGAVLTAIEGLGYKLSHDIFTFDAVPSSVMNNAYRWEISTDAFRELSGRRVEKDKTLELWVAYKLTAKGNTKTDSLAMLTSVEAVEDALMNVLTSLPSLTMRTGMSKFVANYIVFNVSFAFTYWRDL